MLSAGARLASNAIRNAAKGEAAPAMQQQQLQGRASTSLLKNYGYATMAGQPMPPPPPPSNKSDNKPESSTSSDSPASSSSSTPAPSDPANVGEVEQPPQANVRGLEIAPSSSLASQYLDMTEIPAGRTGARSTIGKRPMSTSEKKRRNLGRASLAVTTVGLAYYAWHLGREWDSEKERERLSRNVSNEAGFEGRWQRGQARFWDTLDYFNKPAWDPLLPPPLPPPHQKPYTLVLSLDDLLIHSSWDREHGWRTAKRPGVDYFLAYLSQFYEIVLFTSQPPYTAIPIVEKLDPYMIYILYKLFRDCTRYHNKEVVKDLSYLGRDLKKVIMLDTNPKSFALQPENAIEMPKWQGNRDDTDLVGMIPFLEAFIAFNVPDVREVLKNYKGKHIPSTWAEVEEEQKRALLAEYYNNPSSRRGKLGGMGSLFGVSNPTVRHNASDLPKTQLELHREFYQKAYLEEQKYWNENKANIEKEIEADKERQKREMTSSVVNFFSMQFGLAPPPGSGPENATQPAAPQKPASS